MRLLKYANLLICSSVTKTLTLWIRTSRFPERFLEQEIFCGFLSFYTESSFYPLIFSVFRTSLKITLVGESPG